MVSVEEGSPRPSRDDARFDLALAAGRMGTWSWDLASGRLDWDRPLLAVFGLSSFDGTFETYLACIHPDDRAPAVETIQASLAARRDHYVEHRVLLPDGSLRWVSGTGRVILDDRGEAVGMVGVGADITDRKLAQQRLELLAAAGDLLGSSLDLDVTLQQLSDLAVEWLADWCSVDLVDHDQVRLVAVAHRDPEKVAYARALRERLGVDLATDSGIAAVINTGRPEVHVELTEDWLRAALAAIADFSADDVERFLSLGLRSSMTVPLTTPAGRVVGAMSLTTAESGRRYGDDDVALAVELARRAAVAVENARLYSAADHAARTLQQSLLPPALPDVELAEVASYYAPAGRGELIGGDFYDAWATPDGGLCLVVGDVSGKGVDAAALTAECRWTLRSSLTRTGSPSRALDDLNDALLRHERERFVTVVAAVLAPAGQRDAALTYASAGHPPPLVRRADGTAELLDVDGQIVGVLPGPVARGGTSVLHVGDTLVLYSDGFTEARREGALFGEEGILTTVRTAADDRPRGIVRAVTEAVAAFGRQRDDMALLVAQVRAPVAPETGAHVPDAVAHVDAATLALGAEPDAVPRARHYAAKALAAAPEAAVDDVKLVVTELVTNALLHGREPVTVRLRRFDGTVRVEVRDRGRQMPLRMRPSGGSLTGRGLGLVAMLSDAWGADPVPSGGKVVWAELAEQRPEETAVPLVDVDGLLAGWPDDDEGESLYTVELGDVPTDLLLAAKSHVDNLVREFALDAGGRGEHPTPQLAELVRAVEHDFAAARRQIKRQAVQAAERGDPLTHLRLTLPASAADAAELYLVALDEADRYARDAQVLTLETPAAHRVFRRWYVECVAERLRHAAHGGRPPRVQTLVERLTEEVAALADSREAAIRLDLLQQVTADIAGASGPDQICRSVVDDATSVLGAQSARIYLLQGGVLRAVATSGGDPVVAAAYDEVPVDADLPGGVVLRSGRPLVARSRAHLARLFPALADVYDEECTLLVAPLVVGERQLGVLALSFAGGSSVDEAAQTAFLTALAAVTAQALHRALPAEEGQGQGTA